LISYFMFPKARTHTVRFTKLKHLIETNETTGLQQ